MSARGYHPATRWSLLATRTSALPWPSRAGSAASPPQPSRKPMLWGRTRHQPGRCAVAASLRRAPQRARSSAAARRHVCPCPVHIPPPALGDPPGPERGPAARLRPPAGPCAARCHLTGPHRVNRMKSQFSVMPGAAADPAGFDRGASSATFDRMTSGAGDRWPSALCGRTGPCGYDVHSLGTGEDCG